MCFYLCFSFDKFLFRLRINIFCVIEVSFEDFMLHVKFINIYFIFTNNVYFMFINNVYYFDYTQRLLDYLT